LRGIEVSHRISLTDNPAQHLRFFLAFGRC
jgi:hypothetical protein